MSIINHAKELADLVKKYNDQELYERIVSLRGEILELREENIKLQEQVKTLEEAHTFKGKLLRKGNYYVMDDDPDENNIYCLTCWDHDKKRISLIRGQRGALQCNICIARAKKP